MILRYWKKGVVILLLSFSSSLWGQAVIGSSKTDVCLRALSGGGFRSDNVTYTLNNCTGCNSIEWDVGAGYQATGAPQYVASYNTSGSKNVSCRFRTSSGGSSTISLSNAVFVRDLPVINIGFSDTVVCLAKDSFILTDNSANIVSRQWLVNGQNYNPGPKSIKFGFPENTAVSVFLGVKDIYGCVNNYLKDSAILIGNPVTVGIVPNATSGCAPKLINFSATIDSGAQYVKAFAWTFQNNTPSSSSSRNPRDIRFNLPDTNDVGLTITTGR
jgi:hypothetical protein